MKIGITCHPSAGGSGILATELGLALAERGHEIHFVTLETPFRLREYHANYHNFANYRHELMRRPVALNEALDARAWNAYGLAREFDCASRRDASSAAFYQGEILKIVEEIIENLSDQPRELSHPLREFVELFGRDNINAKDAADMRVFSQWFGRETVYVSLHRPSRPW